jgi:hypothetical protein
MLTLAIVSSIDAGPVYDAARLVGLCGLFALVAVWFNGRTRHFITPRFRDRLGLYYCALYFLLPAAGAAAVFIRLESLALWGWASHAVLWIGCAVPSFLFTICCGRQCGIVAPYSQAPNNQPIIPSGRRRFGE